MDFFLDLCHAHNNVIRRHSIEYSKFNLFLDISWFISGFRKFQNGRRVLLQLLHPNCSRYLSPNDLASLNLFIPSLSAKVMPKLPFLDYLILVKLKY